MVLKSQGFGRVESYRVILKNPALFSAGFFIVAKKPLPKAGDEAIPWSRVEGVISCRHEIPQTSTRGLLYALSHRVVRPLPEKHLS